MAHMQLASLASLNVQSLFFQCSIFYSRFSPVPPCTRLYGVFDLMCKAITNSQCDMPRLVKVGRSGASAPGLVHCIGRELVLDAGKRSIDATADFDLNDDQ